MKKKSYYILFSVLVSLSISTAFLHKYFLITDELFKRHWNNQLSTSKIEDILEVTNEYSWISFVIIPIFYIIKINLISVWILSATILLGYKNTFQEIFCAVLIAEFVWLIPSFVTLIWFGFIDTNYNLIDVQYFKPLSLLNLFDLSEVETWLIFPLQAFNLFEVVYMFILAIGIKRILKKDYNTALNFTIPVYGTALITWIALITFLSINLST
ncbi:MAG: hypothetical protein AAGI25_19565 [Bacteroidota bacterium]